MARHLIFIDGVRTVVERPDVPAETPARRDARHAARTEGKLPFLVETASALGLSITPEQIRANLQAIERGKP